MKIAVTGATGHLGRIVIDKLKSMVPVGDIVGLARSPQKGADLGVEFREADYDKPETLGPALAGIDTLLLISASEIGKRAAQHRNIIHAAKKAGVKWIIYTSLLRADTSSISLGDEHRATEAELKKAGIPFTVLRNGWYTENYTNTIPGALAGGAFIGSAGDGKLSLAARVDYADAAVAVLTTPGHQGKRYELAGDEPYTLSDLAAEISRQTGKKIPYRNLSEADYVSTLKTFGLPDGLAKTIAGWDVAASHGALFDNSRELSMLIQRPTTPLSDVVAQALKAS
jgi:NAD(P)H dehydrogenase (quinone)